MDNPISRENQVIEDVIREFVRTSTLNRLEAFGGASIFEEPLIGFADGDDPLFEQYKTVVHEKHFTPREVLAKYGARNQETVPSSPGHVSVISFVLPIPKETCASNAKETKGPSLRWNHTRWKGHEFMQALSRHLISFISERGAIAVAPDLTDGYRIMGKPQGFAATWSHRHAAYAAGLGTFSLSDAFITPKGAAMRCGSVVTDLHLVPSLRPYSHHLENCLFYTTGKCGLCIKRCPRGAISEQGHDQKRCHEILHIDQQPWLEGVHGPGFIGQYASCFFCVTNVPCENRIPAGTGKSKKAKG